MASRISQRHYRMREATLHSRILFILAVEVSVRTQGIVKNCEEMKKPLPESSGTLSCRTVLLLGLGRRSQCREILTRGYIWHVRHTRYLALGSIVNADAIVVEQVSGGPIKFDA